MGKQDLINNLQRKIEDIETRPKAKEMLKGLKKHNPNEPRQIPDSDPQMKVKLNWKNLKMNLCSKCSSELTWSKDGRLIKCVACDFKIKPKKFDEFTK